MKIIGIGFVTLLWTSQVMADYDFEKLKQPILKYLGDGALVMAIMQSQCGTETEATLINDMANDVVEHLAPHHRPSIDNLLASQYWVDVNNHYRMRVMSFIEEGSKNTDEIGTVCEKLDEMAAATLADAVTRWLEAANQYGMRTGSNE